MSNRRVVWSWALYDLANTIFYGVVVTGYLPSYVIDGLCGGEHAPFALAFYPAMILAGLVSPALGEMADARGVSKRATLIATFACVAATLALPLWSSPGPLLATFACALFSYQSALVFYNALLPTVADARVEGAVSGLGTGLGYLGNVLALPLAMALVARFDGDARPAFVLAGVLFLVFTFPFARFVPEGRARAAADDPAPRRPSLTRTLELLRSVRGRKGLLAYFAGNFLCSDVLGSVYAYLVPFLKSPQGLGVESAIAVLFAINVVAVPTCVVMGRMSDRLGAKRMSIVGAIALGVAITLAHCVAERARADASSELHTVHFGFALYQWIGIVAVVGLGSIGMGGIVGASRQWLLRLVPIQEVGAWYGVYGLTGKLSLLSIWPFAKLRDVTGGYGASIALLAVMLGLGVLCFAAVPRSADGARGVTSGS